jgi:hypothetical protein
LKTKHSQSSLILTIAFLLLVVAIVPSHVALAQSGAIASAQSTLNTCYEAAKQAEAAGANITSLQETLNIAGAQLSKAQYAQSQGDSGSANNYAQQAQNTLSGFEAQANALRDTASRQTQTSFLINVVGSIAGTFAVIGGSIAVWFILKRKNKSQGEAAADES